MNYQITDSPSFMDELMIYEIAVKGFTSPNGPESGDFKSLKDKMSYLQKLGITGIWLSGHQLCDNSHFYNIWTEYACIDPGQLDPTLGTEKDFKEMVEEAHKKGIRIFLDVIPHGIMDNSPIVKQHPDWFKGGSWGMTDFDWYGGHLDLDKWWVDIWCRYVTEFKVDGFRIDVAHYRNDLWALIRKRSTEAGKEILVMMETGPAIKGVSDMLQSGERLSDNHRTCANHRILWDAAGHFLDRSRRLPEQYLYTIHYSDGTIQGSMRKADIMFERSMDNLQAVYLRTEKRMTECKETGAAYEEELAVVRLENIRVMKEIEDVVVENQEGQEWHFNKSNTMEVDYFVEVSGSAPTLIVKFPLRLQEGQYLSVQLSCHDNGWDGFPLGENAYAAKGSRYVMGYGCILTPAIPVMMSGEEFNADYVPLPGHCPGLFSKELVGEGRWLYGSWIQWEQLEQQEKKEMFNDSSKLMHIRQKYRELIRPFRMGCQNNSRMEKLTYLSNEKLPIPYLYIGDKYALLVAANPYADREIELSIKLSEVLNSCKEHIKVHSLYGECKIEDMTVSDFDAVQWKIKRDKSKDGGLLVLLIDKEERR